MLIGDTLAKLAVLTAVGVKTGDTFWLTAAAVGVTVDLAIGLAVVSATLAAKLVLEAALEDGMVDTELIDAKFAEARFEAETASTCLD